MDQHERVKHFLAELERMTEKPSGMLEKEQEISSKGELATGTLIFTETMRLTRALSVKVWI